MRKRFMRNTHDRTSILALALLCSFAAPVSSDESASHDYPTIARVEYVHECMSVNGNDAASMYKCACTIDRIAEKMSYDDFVEASTFARYSTLGGKIGGIFRDPPGAKEKAKKFRDVEAAAYKACGITKR